jgi:hypothetical protein
MLSREQQATIWANAYNAALIGLLAGKMHTYTHFSELNVQSVTQQCKAFADQAVKDATAHDTNEA